MHLASLDLKPGSPVKKLELVGRRTYSGNATDTFVEAKPFGFADIGDQYEAPRK